MSNLTVPWPLRMKNRGCALVSLLTALLTNSLLSLSSDVSCSPDHHKLAAGSPDWRVTQYHGDVIVDVLNISVRGMLLQTMSSCQDES